MSECIPCHTKYITLVQQEKGDVPIGSPLTNLQGKNFFLHPQTSCPAGLGGEAPRHQ